jgi:hypothetical protein
LDLSRGYFFFLIHAFTLDFLWIKEGGLIIFQGGGLLKKLSFFFIFDYDRGDINGVYMMSLLLLEISAQSFCFETVLATIVYCLLNISKNTETKKEIHSTHAVFNIFNAVILPTIR